jgi:hypothetical protein
MEHYTSYEDCVEKSSNIFSYDEKVVRGLIVQIYYGTSCPPELNRPLSSNLQYIKENDAILANIAANFEGRLTGENGIVGERRDIDFEFSTRDLGDSFQSQLLGTKYNVHQDLNIFGTLVAKPSIEKLRLKRERINHIKCRDLYL